MLVVAGYSVLSLCLACICPFIRMCKTNAFIITVKFENNIKLKKDASDIPSFNQPVPTTASRNNFVRVLAAAACVALVLPLCRRVQPLVR